MRKILPTIVGLEDEKGPWMKECRGPPEAEKDKEMNF